MSALSDFFAPATRRIGAWTAPIAAAIVLAAPSTVAAQTNNDIGNTSGNFIAASYNPDANRAKLVYKIDIDENEIMKGFLSSLKGQTSNDFMRWSEEEAEKVTATNLKAAGQEDLIYFIKAVHYMNMPMAKWIVAHPNNIRYSDYPFYKHPEKDPEYQSWVQSQRNDPKMMAAILNINYFYGEVLQQVVGECVTDDPVGKRRVPNMAETSNYLALRGDTITRPYDEKTFMTKLTLYKDVLKLANEDLSGALANGGATPSAIAKMYKECGPKFRAMITSLFPKDVPVMPKSSEPTPGG